MKYKRHNKLIELINTRSIETQEELVELLQQSGFDVTQATVSRDIKELRLIKVVDEKGKNKYIQMSNQDNPLTVRHRTIFRETFVSCDYANNIVVVKTLSGMGPAIGEAVDLMNLPGIVGTVSGDNTTLIICRYEQQAEEIVKKFINLAKSDESK